MSSESELDQAIAMLLSLKSQMGGCTSPSKQTSSRRVLRDVANTLISIASRPVPLKTTATTPPPHQPAPTPTPPRKLRTHPHSAGSKSPTRVSSPEKRAQAQMPLFRAREAAGLAPRTLSPTSGPISGRRPQSAPPVQKPPVSSPRVLSPRAAPASFVRSPPKKTREAENMRRLEAIYGSARPPGRPSKVKPQFRRPVSSEPHRMQTVSSTISLRPEGSVHQHARLISPTASAAAIARASNVARGGFVASPVRATMNSHQFAPESPSLVFDVSPALPPPRENYSPPVPDIFDRSDEVRLVDTSLMPQQSSVFDPSPIRCVESQDFASQLPPLTALSMTDREHPVFEFPPQTLTLSDSPAQEDFPKENSEEHQQTGEVCQLDAALDEREEAGKDENENIVQSPRVQSPKQPHPVASTRAIVEAIMKALDVSETDSVHSSLDSLVVQEAAIAGEGVSAEEDFKRAVLADLVVEISRRKLPSVGYLSVRETYKLPRLTAVGPLGLAKPRMRWTDVAAEAEARWEMNGRPAKSVDVLMDKKKLNFLLDAEIDRIADELKYERTQVNLKDAFVPVVHGELVQDIVDMVIDDTITRSG